MDVCKGKNFHKSGHMFREDCLVYFYTEIIHTINLISYQTLVIDFKRTFTTQEYCAIGYWLSYLNSLCLNCKNKLKYKDEKKMIDEVTISEEKTFKVTDL